METQFTHLMKAGRKCRRLPRHQRGLQLGLQLRRSARTKPSRARRGAATVEFALTIGLAFFFFFAALEFSRVSMLRHTVDHACYEACRVGVISGATASDVEARARQVMSTASARNFSVQVTPNPIESSSRTISVTVGLALDENLYAPAQFVQGRRFERTFTMQRELPGG